MPAGALAKFRKGSRQEDFLYLSPLSCMFAGASVSHIKPNQAVQRLFNEFKTIPEDDSNSCSNGNRRQPYTFNMNMRMPGSSIVLEIMKMSSS